MWHPDEGLVHSWLDGAASDAEARSIDEHLSVCDSCRALVAEARGLVAGASRIIGALDNVPGDVIPVPSGVQSGGEISTAAAAAVLRTARAHKPPFWMTSTFRMAAGLALVVGVSTVAMRDQLPFAKEKASIAPAENERGSRVEVDRQSADTGLRLSEPSGKALGATTPPAPTISALEKKEVAGDRERNQSEFTRGAPPRNEARENLAGKQQVGRVDSIATGTAVANAASARDSSAKAAEFRNALAGKVAGVQLRAAAPPADASLRGLADLAGKDSLLQRRFADGSSATRVEKLPPVLSLGAGRPMPPALDRAERESSGCYVLTTVSADGDARRVRLASSLVGMVELEGEPTVDSVPPVAATGAISSAQQGQQQTQGVGQAQQAGGGGGAGAAGASGAGAATGTAGGVASAAGGRGGAAGGGAGRGGGGGRGGARGGGSAGRAAVEEAPVLAARTLGWRMISTDSIEVRVAIDTTFIALRLRRGSDSTLTGIARVTTDSTVGVVGTVTAQKAACM